MAGAIFEGSGIAFGYPGARHPAVQGVDLAVPEGATYAILGPNGSGKSTLLKLMLGVLRPGSGTLRYAGREVSEWDRRDLAQRVGVVAQTEEIVFPVTVRDLVSMGRYPHLGPWRRPGRDDYEAIENSMARCEVAEFAARPISTLSGGERQRARLARALAQEPSTLVLDEPTASLDIAHEMAMFELLATLARRDGATVVIVTHNINLAARYAERLLLLDAGKPMAEGTPAEVLTRETVERIYRWPVNVQAHAGPGPDTGAPQVVPLAGTGEDRGE
jgi:iron complex transport system ATP-binding protein